MANLPTLINGQSYSYADIVLLINGVAFASVSEINYTGEQEKTNNYGTSGLPVSRGRGAREFSGSLKIAMDDAQKLRDASPDGSLLGIPAFDIQVTFVSPQTTKLVSHFLKSCEFTKDGVEASQGDTEIAMSHDIVIGNIKYR